jgi:hypothetical protein
MSKPIRYRIWQSKKDLRWRYAEHAGNGRSTDIPGQGFASHAGVIRALERKYQMTRANVPTWTMEGQTHVMRDNFHDSQVAAAIRIAIDAEMARWAKRKGAKK